MLVATYVHVSHTLYTVRETCWTQLYFMRLEFCVSFYVCICDCNVCFWGC